MKAKLSYFILLFLTVILLSRCLKVESFPDEPVVEFTSFEIANGEATLNFSFTDGDGNFGLTEEDANTPPFDEGIYQNNLIVDYWELQNGEWQRFGNDFPQTSPFYIAGGFNNRVEWLIPEGTNQTQQGDVSYDMGSFYFNPDSPFDTCRFTFYIIDRDLNESNTSFTSSFLKP